MLERARARLRRYPHLSDPRHHRAIRRALTAISCGLLGVVVSVLVAGFAAPALESRIDAASISPERGGAFIAPVIHRVPFLYSVYGSDIGAPASARLVLFENGIPLGPEDSNHELIRNSAKGAYSHWGNTLYFSSSDGSDPRKNGRDYTYRVGAGLKPIVRRIGIVAAFLGLFCFSFSRRLRASDEGHPTIADAMQYRLVRRAGSVLLATGVAWIATLLIGPWVQQPEKLPIAPESVKHAGGAAYYASLPAFSSWPWRPVRELTSMFLPSPPQVLENGTPIGTPSSSVLEVVRSGQGRFSYFDDLFAFSASDNSDPRTNGRRYVLETPESPATRAWILGLALLIIGMGVLGWQGTGGLSDAVFRFGPAPGSSSGRGRSIADYSVMVLGMLAATAIVVLSWRSGSTSHLGVVSYFPVSDAFGYYQCALSIGMSDTLKSPYFGEWCSRRALYPAMLSSLLSFAGWRSSITLLLQAAIIGLSASLLLLALQRMFGWMTALLCAFGVLIMAREFSLGNFMTESLGLAAGLVGLALLILSLRNREPLPWPFVSGFALISLGMALRIGAMFALPILAVWALYATRTMAWRSRWRLLLVSMAALCLGIALHFVVVYLHGGNARNTGGNSSVVLYGLSTGSRDWAQAHRDFADRFANRSEALVYREIRDAAIDNIRARPEVFLGSLREAGIAFGYNLFVIGAIGKVNGLATALFLIGICVCLFHFHQPVFALLFAVATAELISAPFVFDSGGHRVFVVTAPARMALVGLAAGWLLAMTVGSERTATARVDGESTPVGDCAIRRAAGGLATILVLLVLFPSTPFANAFRSAPIPLSGVCSEGELEVVARLGSESMQLTFGEHRLPIFNETLGVAVGRLEVDPASRGTWWLSKFEPQPRGSTLVYAVQRASKNPGMVVPAFAEAPLDSQSYRLVSLCLRSETPATVSLGDLAFHRITHLHPRQEPAPLIR